MFAFRGRRPIHRNVRVVRGQIYRKKQACSFSQLASPSEIVSIPCPGNGTISLDIYYPKRIAIRSVRPAVAIYLPRGPILTDPAQDASNVSILTTVLPYPVVKINYRFDEHFKFPTPIYDMMAGYDWVQQNLLPKKSFVRAGRPDRFGVIATCGEVIGGQLALVLALTECRIGESGVVAAAVNNPVVDWVSSGNAENNDSEVKQISLSDILRKRDKLFAKPEGYFDPFASPIHFFRTAGINVPPAPAEKTILDDMEELAHSERDYTYTPDTTSSVPPDKSDSGSGAEDIRSPRKVSLRYPSVAFGLKLPKFQFTVGERFPTFDQVEEITRHLQRSFKRENKAKYGVDGAASDALTYVKSPGLGLWDDTGAGHARLLNVAHWIAQNTTN